MQRVSKASVTVGDETVGRIGAGLLVFIGLSRDDSEAEARHIVDKTVNLRIFPDETGRFNRSALDVGAALLVISQFTLYGDTRKGRRPSFAQASPPEQAGTSVRQDSRAVRGVRAQRWRGAGSRPTWMWPFATTARSPSCWTPQTGPAPAEARSPLNQSVPPFNSTCGYLPRLYGHMPMSFLSGAKNLGWGRLTE